MQSRRTVVWALGVLLAASLPLSMGCQNEVPTGKIEPETVTVKVDEPAHLELLLSSKYEGVNREMWKVEPEDLGKVFFNQAEAKRRKATFQGKKAGAGKVVVFGFFGDAKKPYRIAEVPVTVE